MFGWLLRVLKMGFYRSEEMMLFNLYCPSDIIQTVVATLGEMGIVQFVDLMDIDFSLRQFAPEVQQCDSLELQLLLLISDIQSAKIEILRDDTPLLSIGVPSNKDLLKLGDTTNYTELDLFRKLTRELNEVTSILGELQKKLNGLAEQKAAVHLFHSYLSQINRKFVGTHRIVGTEDRIRHDLEGHGPNTKLLFIQGVIEERLVIPFEKSIWGYSAGNALFLSFRIRGLLKDPETGFVVKKYAFLICYGIPKLTSKFLRIAEGYGATLYYCPSSRSNRIRLLEQIAEEIFTVKTIIEETSKHRMVILKTAAESVRIWYVMIKKTKAVYHTMNFFYSQGEGKSLVAQGWVAKRHIKVLNKIITEISEHVQSQAGYHIDLVKTHSTPPTYYATNKFTQGFQNIVDAYGIPSYGEINAALFTVVTFPFLFSVMFGDWGHAIILTVAASYLVTRETYFQKIAKNNEIVNILFSGRYIILLMGLFSLYTGAIYNDGFSKFSNHFGSSWRVNFTLSDVTNNAMLQLDPATDHYFGTPYPLGIDPIWQFACNQLDFMNAYKMKIAIIIGVIHMTFGIILSAVNYINTKRYVVIICKTVPQLLFFVGVFGYLVGLFFFKWIAYGAKNPDPKYGPSCAPSILISFINMIMNKENPVPEGCSPTMYTGQKTVEMVIKIVALISMPWMFLGEAGYIMYKMRQSFKKRKAPVPTSNDYLEMMVHQGIETIEFILGSISYTASYLRLWALSLAHSQLSEVLWFFIMKQFSDGVWYNFIAIPIGFVVWSLITVSVLVIMEGLSAFLHALRLHWVEFQGKFFVGEGYYFQPLHFDKLVDESFLYSKADLISHMQSKK